MSTVSLSGFPAMASDTPLLDALGVDESDTVASDDIELPPLPSEPDDSAEIEALFSDDDMGSDGAGASAKELADRIVQQRPEIDDEALFADDDVDFPPVPGIEEEEIPELEAMEAEDLPPLPGMPEKDMVAAADDELGDMPALGEEEELDELPPLTLPKPPDTDPEKDLEAMFDVPKLPKPGGAKVATEEPATGKPKESAEKKTKKAVKPKTAAVKSKPEHDYKSKQLSEKVYKKQYAKPNKHLPKAWFYSDYQRLFFYAVRRGDINGVRAFLSQNMDKEMRNKRGETALMVASRSGQLAMVELLLGKGANANAQDNDGYTPLHVAAMEGRADIIHQLKTRGAYTDVMDSQMRTPLVHAVNLGNLDAARALLENGADVDQRANNQQTPLHIAAANGSIPLVRLLLKHGANVNLQDAQGRAALHYAGYFSHSDVAELLIRSGAHPGQQDHQGLSAKAIAAYAGQTPTVAEYSHYEEPFYREPVQQFSAPMNAPAMMVPAPAPSTQPLAPAVRSPQPLVNGNTVPSPRVSANPAMPQPILPPGGPASQPRSL